MNIAAITIWYNPITMQNPSATEVIQSYISSMNKVYIIDNSDNDNSSLIKDIPNVIYLPNFKNLGIASALNQGCLAAKKDGYEWCMTMDQDSFFSEDELNKYISLCKHYYKSDNTIKSFAPAQKDFGDQNLATSKKIIKNLITFFAPDFFENRAKNKILPNISFVDRIMTSANIINLNTWEQIGKFDDILFIDEVDHDFCTRLILANYKILKINNVFVNHKLGNPIKSFFPKIIYENDFRLFYIFRNIMIENHRYGKINKVRNYKKELWFVFRDYCILDKHFIIHFKIFIKAYNDYKRIINSI